MNIDDISFEDFAAYVKLQRSGRINMTDIVTGSRLTGLPESVYEAIIWNYSDLCCKWGAQLKGSIKEDKDVAEQPKKKTAEIVRISKRHKYDVTFYSNGSDTDGYKVVLGDVVWAQGGVTGCENIYDILKVLPRDLRAAYVHIKDIATEQELLYSIYLAPGLRINAERYQQK